MIRNVDAEAKKPAPAKNAIANANVANEKNASVKVNAPVVVHVKINFSTKKVNNQIATRTTNY